ncbi:LOW QUALITY PROTEIN: tetratricopeptide repeat protein 24-like [Xenia sp. Carnegie-2017]|uniref:LOW QUALITY PROTEIN: tetratricopeptide repeat protein 24-like n=1 Tax=Xenia sp. Carnegie-2017 TaxID=2897299 RepID=UPI001F04DB7F|nr:LOW QUALITY PROTEIN: tetratricopeptide repeat protein 24-like [Xenia sp. Carnegie-2017]
MGEIVTDKFAQIENLTVKGHECLQDGDLNTSYSRYKEALGLAEEIHDGFVLRTCLFNIGACCVARNEPHKGLQYLVRAIPAERNFDGVLNFSDLNYNMGIAYDLLSNPYEAKGCYQTALNGYRAFQVGHGGRDLSQTGGHIGCSWLTKVAVDVLQEAERVFHKLKDYKQELLAVSSRATLLAELQDDMCQSLLTDLVHKVDSLDEDITKAKVYSDIGLLYASFAQHDSAAKYFENSLQLLQSIGLGDHKLVASVNQNLGAVYNQIGEYMKSIGYHEKAIDLYGVLLLRYAQGHSFSNLGFAYGQLGEFGKSKENFNHALQAAKDSQDYKGQWQAYEGLSAINFHQKNYEKAVDLLKTALTIVPYSGVEDNENVHERIVQKLSNALEAQLLHKHVNNDHDEIVGDPPRLQQKELKMKEKNILNVDVHPIKGHQGSEKIALSDQIFSKSEPLKDTNGYRKNYNENMRDNSELLSNGNANQSSTKVGHVRPREKNHKFIARGLHVDETFSGNEHLDASTSPFDAISSYSGHSSSILEHASDADDGAQKVSQHEIPAGSMSLQKEKKNKLNNTYEQPQDIINAINSEGQHLHNCPPGPRDSVLASMSKKVDKKQETILQTKNTKKTKSTVCVIQ